MEERLKEVLIRQNENGDLISIRKVKALLSQIKTVFDRSRGQDDLREFSMTCVESKKEFPLLCSRRQSCCRPRSLANMHDHGRFDHSREAAFLDHEGETPS